MRTELGSFSVGDSVSFSMSFNEKGQPQARELDFFELAEADTMAPAPKRGKVAPAPKRRQVAHAAPAAPDERLSGVVKSFVQAKGYGFIDCPEAKDMYGFDV